MLLRGLRARLSAERHPISIQTNGALLSGRHLDLFAETRTSVSVSIDGPPEVNDLGRVDHRGESTYAATLRGIRRLASHPESGFLFAGTLSVVQPAVDAGTVYEFLKQLGTPSMDFLLQDGNHDRLPPGKSGFHSTEYGEWLTESVRCVSRGFRARPVRILDDLIKLCLGGMSRKEGQGKDPYGILIIETDGEIRKNDTLRASFEGADRFDGGWNVVTAFAVERPVVTGIPRLCGHPAPDIRAMPRLRAALRLRRGDALVSLERPARLRQPFGLLP